MLDRSVWPWDQALYGKAALEVIEVLEHHPFQWPVRMLYVMRAQPPGIAWVGQGAAALGLGLGAAGPALLGVMVAALTLTLWFCERTARALGGTPAAASLACGFLAASPLCVGLSRQFFVEPLQTAAVAWVVCVAAEAPKRSRLRTGLELVAAVSLAMLAKATSPLYILAPGMLAMVGCRGQRSLAAPGDTPDGPAEKEARDCVGARSGRGRAISGLAGSIASIGLGIATGYWYLRNWRLALEHLTSGNSLVGRLYGEREGLAASLGFWAHALQRSFALPSVALALLIALVAGGIRGDGSSSRWTRWIAAGAAVHVLLVVGLMVVTHNREPRFLLPLLPHLGVLVGVSASRIRASWPMWLAGGALFLQWSYLQALSFGFGDYDPRVSHWVVSIDSEGKHARQLEDTFHRTCVPDREGLTYVLAELPWLNVNSLAFRAAEDPWPALERCQYTWPGANGATTQDEIWKQLENKEIREVVVVDPAGLPASSDPAITATGPATSAVLERLRASSAYVEERSFKENLAVRFFHRKN